MQFSKLLLACVAISVLTVRPQDPDTTQQSPREELTASAWYFGYPDGMLFHTAFHGGYTTRFLLLKTALRSDELAKYFALTEGQRIQIQNLKMVTIDSSVRKLLADDNAEPDEQIVRADYFAFLSDAQLASVDLVAFRFDGYCALTRSSLARHLAISEPAQTKIRAIVRTLRDNVFLPRFRWEFAAPLPADITFRSCQFAGSICAQANLQIINALTDEECRRVLDFISTVPTNAVIAEIEELAPLPKGLSELLKYTSSQKDGANPKNAPKRR